MVMLLVLSLYVHDKYKQVSSVKSTAHEARDLLRDLCTPPRVARVQGVS